MSKGAPKGHPKAGGRKKGTPNKVTAGLRQWISELIDDNREQIVKDLQSEELSPAQRLAILEKLMQYVIPKQRETAVTLESLNDEQLNELIKDLTKDIEQ